jgi:hypothetical protein
MINVGIERLKKIAKKYYVHQVNKGVEDYSIHDALYDAAEALDMCVLDTNWDEGGD